MSLIKDKTNNFYFVYGLAVALFTLSLATLNSILIITTALLLLISIAFLHSGHIINNLLVKGSKIVILSGNYRLGQNNVSISRKMHNSFRSISIAILKPRSSQTNTNSLRELFDSLNEHFEFSIELKEIDKNRILEELKTKLRIKEIALSRADQKSYERINSIKRNIDIINNEISAIANGGKSFEFEIKIKSICTSEDQADAEFSSAKNAESLANKFSAALGVDHQMLSGENLLEHSGV